ncbi:conserved hypothetical protein [Trichinella spiralis]|uniref:hypothetical protein n=1 Tax=Trichinella spiralis TaxID=6334 RepID=UPI0001EFEFE3|nr:conserved hypothetical protein [Trichinella spiralis]
MRQWYDSCTRGRVGCENTGCSIAVFRRVKLGSVDEPSRSARKDDRARDSAFDLPVGTTVVARVFVHFEAVQSQRTELAEFRGTERRPRKEIAIDEEFWDPIRCPTPGKDTPNPLL